MAKKRTESKSAPEKPLHAAFVRRGTHTPESLRHGAEELRLLAAQLAGIAKTMEEGRVDEITVDGTTKLGRGRDMIRDFLEAAEKGLVSEKWRRKD